MMRVDQQSLRLTILAMDQTRVSARTAAKAAILAAGAIGLDTVKQNMSLRDHSLADLRAMDHPYARRHGSIRIHRSGGGGMITHPETRVHTHSGSMLGATRGRLLTSGGSPTFRIRVDTGVAPHAVYVIQGTRIMLGRDVVWNTLTAPGTMRGMRKAMITMLGPILRTKAMVRV